MVGDAVKCGDVKKHNVVGGAKCFIIQFSAAFSVVSLMLLSLQIQMMIRTVMIE